MEQQSDFQVVSDTDQVKPAREDGSKSSIVLKEDQLFSRQAREDNVDGAAVISCAKELGFRFFGKMKMLSFKPTDLNEVLLQIMLFSQTFQRLQQQLCKAPVSFGMQHRILHDHQRRRLLGPYHPKLMNSLSYRVIHDSCLIDLSCCTWFNYSSPTPVLCFHSYTKQVSCNNMNVPKLANFAQSVDHGCACSMPFSHLQLLSARDRTCQYRRT